MRNTGVAGVSHEGVDRTDDTSVVSNYSSRLSSLQAELGAAQSVRNRSLIFVVGFICLGICLFGLTHRYHAVTVLWFALPLVGACCALHQYVRSGARWLQIEKRCDYFERGIRRLTGTWQGYGRTGMEFARENHPYQSDLNVIGDGSLFQLLCTTRSEFGAERLADYLLEPVSLPESRLRQEAVRELQECAELREKMDLLGDF